MKRLPKTIALLAMALLNTAVRAQDPAVRGRALVAENCARCHAIEKTGASPHASAPPFRALGRDFDLDRFAGRLERGIVATHPDMPEFRLNAADASAVIAYLRTIQP